MKWTDYEVTKRLHHFKIDFDSMFYKEHFKGDFTCKKQNIKDSIAIEVKKSDLTEGRVFDQATSRGISREVDFFCTAVATCKVVLTKTPEWFDLEELELCEDHDLVMLVSQEVLNFEGSFRRSTPEAGTPEAHSEGTEEIDKSGGSSTDDSEVSRKGEDGVGDAEEMVVEQVPSITKIG